MKITYKQYNAVAAWKWDIKPSTASSPEKFEDAMDEDESVDGDSAEEEEEEEEDDDVCGICQLEFESACPQCKVPGDDCPLSEYSTAFTTYIDVLRSHS